MPLKFTPEVKQKYLELFTQTGRVSDSAKACGISGTTIKDHRRQDPQFDAACKIAYGLYCDSLEAEVFRRAVLGWNEPVFYRGEVCGHIQRWSDRMLELHVKRHIPEYREKQTVDLTVNGGVLVVPGLTLTPDEWERKYREGEQANDQPVH